MLKFWVIFLAETSKDLEMILITTVLSCTNSLSRTSFDFSLKSSFVYSNLFSLAETVTIRWHIPEILLCILIASKFMEMQFLEVNNPIPILE